MRKTVLITGASRGIGKAEAIRFSQEGYQVVVNYNHSEEEAQSLVRQLNRQGGNAAAIQADVSRREEVIRMVEQAASQFGTIDVLVNNAGIAVQKMFQDISEEEWDALFDVNVKGAVLCCQAVLPGMLHQKAGAIVNTSSIWGLTGASCEVCYSAAKSAVIGLTKALAKELGPSGIRVNCVAPGVVDTEMNGQLSEEIMEGLKEETPLERIGTPEEIADCVLFLASEQSRFLTGQVLSPNGGIVI